MTASHVRWRRPLVVVIATCAVFVLIASTAYGDPTDPAATCQELVGESPQPHPCEWPEMVSEFATELDPKTFAEPMEPGGPIEDRYFEPGPWSVEVELEFACCDSAGNSYAVYRPRHLGVGGVEHPIVTWGNGSDGSPEGYDYFLRHVASWGFVVIATREDQTGEGTGILDAARFAIAANDDPSSIFFDKLATDQVGVMGHSQGASGALNALRKSDGLIKTAVLFHIPENGCWSCPPAVATGESGWDEVDWSSLFFVTGSNDLPISSAEGNAWWYEEFPSSIPKARGRLDGPTHGDINGQPGCRDVGSSATCFNGVYGYLGYPTAWLMDRLQSDRYARGAFVSGGGGEMFENANWDHVTTDNIEPPKGKGKPARGAGRGTG